jgi:hypothetical protein
MTRIRGDWALLAQINNAIVDKEIPPPVQEFQFAPPRKFLFDYAWLGVTRNVALEYEGGTYSRGSHVRPERYRSDCEKYNLAQLMGWVVLRVTVDMVREGTVIDLLKRALSPNGEKG